MRHLSSTLLLSLLGCASAPALIISGPNGTGSGNSTQGSLATYLSGAGSPAFPYWDNIIQVSDSSGVYLGASGTYGWVMTAAHVVPLGIGNIITVASTAYAVHDIQLIGSSDLRMYRIGGELGDAALPGIPNVLLATTTPVAGTSLLDFGRGSRQEGTANSATNSDIAEAPGANPTYYDWGSASMMRWGTNTTINLPAYVGGPTGSPSATFTVGPYTTNLVYSSFEDVGSGNYLTATEAHFATGDSGGGMFTLNGSNWELTGWNAYVLGDPGNPGQPGSTSAFGNMAFYGNIPAVKSSIEAAFVPEPSVGCLILAMGGVLLRRQRGRK
jgi:hypothetical protein